MWTLSAIVNEKWSWHYQFGQSFNLILLKERQLHGKWGSFSVYREAEEQGGVVPWTRSYRKGSNLLFPLWLCVSWSFLRFLVELTSGLINIFFFFNILSFSWSDCNTERQCPLHSTTAYQWGLIHSHFKNVIKFLGIQISHNITKQMWSISVKKYFNN